MDELDDELDLRFHRGLNPDVYYRCPTLESLEGALRNEMDKMAAILIPTEIVTEFVFGVGSTITVPVTQQSNLEAMIHPAEFPQSITVELALCRNTEGKERLRTQCFIEIIQKTDGFKYLERQASNKDGGDGTRFKYVCVDSLQNQHRKRMAKREKVGQENQNEETEGKKRRKEVLPTYDCGGAIHIKSSIKREAVNVVYKHNPIHRDVESHPRKEQDDDNHLPALSIEGTALPNITNGSLKVATSQMRKKDRVELDNEFGDPDSDMPTSPETSKTPPKKKQKRITSSSLQVARSSNEKRKGKRPQPPFKSCRKTPVHKSSPQLLPAKPTNGKACLRCREKEIKCNEAKPTCNQCRRGLWTCQYKANIPHKRSKTGCINCRQRKRKCTEEKPSCAYYSKVDDDCECPLYSRHGVDVGT
ncbi:hypothetical protein K505DRAFT_351438 [Melanomma pulvis-pyrius CBS 109.77]|uniref:Zn(2)-C6 fungal-type domain-containing protein n=1 Tax=Melanomma pulvis-pyrius CBS 109.77 TaxID=1314802 RepID=A0A6A6X412_9PLEO|nr:hypothetical protein K505DRAFT_351438 [Melanomma pulvis-pyrius CBS 109.77]